MTGYWKNQRQYEGAVKVSAASMGGPGAGKVPGLPVVSGGSDQANQDESEGKGCDASASGLRKDTGVSQGREAARPKNRALTMTRTEPAAKEPGGESGQPFLSESSDPLCLCEERVCRCTDAQRAYLEAAIEEGAALSLDGRERTYSGVYGVEKYERKCLNCGEWFELLAQPDEDRRLFCSRGCYACPPDYREEA